MGLPSGPGIVSRVTTERAGWHRHVVTGVTRTAEEPRRKIRQLLRNSLGGERWGARAAGPQLVLRGFGLRQRPPNAAAAALQDTLPCALDDFGVGGAVETMPRVLGPTLARPAWTGAAARFFVSPAGFATSFCRSGWPLA